MKYYFMITTAILTLYFYTSVAKSHEVNQDSIETLQLDTFHDGFNTIASSTPLAAGETWLITARGTYSRWNVDLWANLCEDGGIPEDAPLIPSPGIANGSVGLDPAYDFAYPDAYSNCQNLPSPPLLDSVFWFSLDNGATWFFPSPIRLQYNPDHEYEYIVNGEGYPFLMRQHEVRVDDNYGIIMVTLELLDEAIYLPMIIKN